MLPFPMSLTPILRLPSPPPILSALRDRFLALLPTCKPSSLRTFPPVFLLTPLDSALTDSCARKSFRIRSYEKTYGGHPPPNQTNENNRGPICIAEPITPALSTSHPAVSTAPAMAAAACPLPSLPPHSASSTPAPQRRLSPLRCSAPSSSLIHSTVCASLLLHHCGAVAVRRIPQFLFLQTRFAESSSDNLRL